MKTDGLCFFCVCFTSLQLFTLPPHNFVVFFFPHEWDELSRFVKAASLEFIVWWKYWQMKGREVWGMSWQMTETYMCQLFMGTHICLGFPLIPICNVAINAHLQPRNQKLALSTVGKKKINWQRSKYVILSFERIDGQGWMDERKTQHACFLHLVTTVSVLSRPICPATQQQRVTLCIWQR